MSARENWDTVRRLADELQLKLHLAGMDIRDRWCLLEPKLAEAQRTLAARSRHATDAVERELAALGAALRRLIDDLDARTRS